MSTEADTVAPFLIFLSGTGADHQQVLEAVSAWKKEHDSAFTANLETRIGRNPNGDVLMISTRIHVSASHSVMEKDLKRALDQHGIAIQPEK